MADKAKDVVKTGATRAITAFFEYDTPKIVHIRSKTVGVINRIIQLGVFAYIIGYAIIYEKGYQDFETVTSASLTKMKGVYYRTNVSGFAPIPDVTDRIWDVADYVVPAEEADATFVTTNVILTANQTQGTCDEDPSMLNVLCDGPESKNCTKDEPVVNGNGVRTGNCIESTQKPGTYVCEIHAWCPVEVDEEPFNRTTYVIENADTFTLLIKNYVEFAKFDIKRRNIVDDVNNQTYLQTCRYNSETDPFCPVFELGVMVKLAGQNFTQMAFEGGVIGVDIEWNCDFDYDESKCKPEYSFRRLDDPSVKIAKGWNFRYPHFYREQGLLTRDLYKVYGIRILVRVTGEAGKFSIVPLLLTIGSGVGLLAIATVLCDIIAFNLLKQGPFYKENKYLYVTDDDAFQSGLWHTDTSMLNIIDHDYTTNHLEQSEGVSSTEGTELKTDAAHEGAVAGADVYAYDQEGDTILGVKNRKSGSNSEKLED